MSNTKKKPLNEFFTFLAILVGGLCLLVSAGYEWARDDSFLGLIGECNKKEVVHRVIGGESLHIECKSIEMKKEWVKYE